MTRPQHLANQFKRKYELHIITDAGTKIISDLRVVFDIIKSMRSYPNIAMIDLYNPNGDTISRLYDDPILILKAGYEGNIGLIFKGRIRNIFNNKVAENRIITIYAGDGQREWENTIINKTYSENIKVKDLVKDVLTTLLETGELNLGSLQDLDDRQADKLIGVSLSGSTKDVMDKLANDYSLVWSIQDGEIVVMDENRALEASEIVLVNQTTGMIGSPTVTEIGADVTSLLNPKLLPNTAFRIESLSSNIALSNLQFRTPKRSTAEGDYRAFDVTFNGDTHGTNWYSIARGTSVNV